MALALGVLGVGVIASAVVRGLGGTSLGAVTLSPRNAAKAAELQRDFPEVRIAGSNQEVVDASECVLVAVLPTQAEKVLKGLVFREDQQVISLMAGLSLSQLRALCGSEKSGPRVCIAIPYPAVAKRQGAALLLQPTEAAETIFQGLGRCVAVQKEAEFRYLMCISGLMGNFYKQQLTAQRWLEARGVPAAAASAWAGASFAAFAADSAEPREETLEELLAEQTPGGLNEKVWQLMDAQGSNQKLCSALEAVHKRLTSGRFPDSAPAALEEASLLTLLGALLRWPFRRRKSRLR